MAADDKFHFRICVGDIEVEGSGPEEYVKDVRAYAEQLVSIIADANENDGGSQCASVIRRIPLVFCVDRTTPKQRRIGR